jgi:glycosyltransferase involved in cell wall biosynthesis
MQSCYFIAVGWWGSNSSVRRQFKALADGLADRGHRVVLLVENGPAEAVDPHSNPAVYVWPSRRPTRLRDAQFLVGLLRRYRPNVVIANWAAVNWMMLLGRLAGVGHRIAWYHTLSSQMQIDLGGSFGFKHHVQRWRKRWIYGMATHLVAVSEAARRDASENFGIPAQKCTVFYNFLEDPLLSEKPAAPEAGRVVCVGRIDPSKGQDVLIRAAALLRREVPDARFEFVGSGQSRDACERLAESLGVADRCRFHGSLPPDEVLRTLRSAAVAVVPSRSDNCPLVVVEALASGTPVIAASVGGITEMMRDGVDGYFVPPDNPDALAERIRVLLTSPGLREHMSQNARERFFSMFEAERSVTELVRWLEALN